MGLKPKAKEKLLDLKNKSKVLESKIYMQICTWEVLQAIYLSKTPLDWTLFTF